MARDPEDAERSRALVNDRLGRLFQHGRDMTPSAFGDIVERAVVDATDPRVRASQLSALEDRVADIAGVVREVAEGVLRAEVREEKRTEGMARMRDEICAGELRVQQALDRVVRAVDRRDAATTERIESVEKKANDAATEIAEAKVKVKTAVGVATFIGAGLFWLAEKVLDTYLSLKGQK